MAPSGNRIAKTMPINKPWAAAMRSWLPLAPSGPPSPPEGGEGEPVPSDSALTIVAACYRELGGPAGWRQRTNTHPGRAERTWPAVTYACWEIELKTANSNAKHSNALDVWMNVWMEVRSSQTDAGG